MAGQRKRYTADFKAKVALEAIRGELTITQLVAKHGVHQTLIHGWKKQRWKVWPGYFRPKRMRRASCHSRDREAAREDRRVGCGTGFFAQGLRSMSAGRRREMIEPEHPGLSIVRQCALLSISRSHYYGPLRGESTENLG